MSDAYLAIVNPAAGGGRCGQQIEGVLSKLRKAGLEIDVEETSGPGQASEIAADAYRGGRRKFLGAGGDGTSYEIVNGLFPAAEGAAEKDRPSLGFLPLGTGNSFLRDFTDEGADYAIAAVIEGKQRPCDVLRLHHRDGVLHYINIGSVGFAAQVNGRRARGYSGWGELGYVAATVMQVIGLDPQPFNIRVDGGEFDREPLSFACFNNSKFTGGTMKMCPHADTADGKIAYLRVASMGRFDLLATFPKVYKGEHLKNPAVTAENVEVLEFDLDQEVDVMLDGEALRLVPKKVDVLPSALVVQA
jgi:YegS/Rv2252/BmrU family lipid kinase